MESTFGGWAQTLSSVVAGDILDAEQARGAMQSVLSGEATPAQIAGLLIGLRVRGEDPSEMDAFVDAMLEAATPLVLHTEDAVDIVGTGGSVRRRERALNVSTAASFVAAACGVPVCKHGNRKASSTSGSTDVLEALGIGVELDANGVANCVEAAGVGFAFARIFHPAMRFAGPVRAELAVPTLFNLLGPLSHPARVRRGVIGVGDPNRFELVAETLARRSPTCVWVVHGNDGLDEISTSGTTRVSELRGDVRRDFELAPEAFGLDVFDGDIGGGDPEANATIIRRVLNGETCPEADLIAVNAAAAVLVGGLADDLDQAMSQVRQVLSDGSAAQVLTRLQELTN